MDLSEHRSQLESILEMEMKDVKPLDEDKVDKLKSILGLDYTPHIFYNSTNIILVDNLEYDKLKTVVDKIEDVLKLEMSQFNLHLFIGNYINCSKLKSIIGV